MMCYLFGGFLGIACGLVGMLSTPILLMTNTFVSGFSHDGVIFANLGKLSEGAANNIKSFAKGAANYTVYI